MKIFNLIETKCYKKSCVMDSRSEECHRKCENFDSHRILNIFVIENTKKRTCVKHSPIKRWRKLKHEFCTIKMKAMVDTEQELCSNRGIRKKWFIHFTTERFIHVIKCHSVHRPQNPHECWWRLRYAIDQNDNDNRFSREKLVGKMEKRFIFRNMHAAPHLHVLQNWLNIQYSSMWNRHLHAYRTWKTAFTPENIALSHMHSRIVEPHTHSLSLYLHLIKKSEWKKNCV